MIIHTFNFTSQIFIWCIHVVQCIRFVRIHGKYLFSHASAHSIGNCSSRYVQIRCKQLIGQFLQKLKNLKSKIFYHTCTVHVDFLLHTKKMPHREIIGTQNENYIYILCRSSWLRTNTSRCTHAKVNNNTSVFLECHVSIFWFLRVFGPGCHSTASSQAQGAPSCWFIHHASLRHLSLLMVICSVHFLVATWIEQLVRRCTAWK